MISGSIVYMYYRISNWKEICPEEEMKLNAQNLNSTESLPPNFYEVWDKLYPDSRNESMTNQSLEVFLSAIGLERDRTNCRCDEIGYISWNNPNYKWHFNQTNLHQKLGYMQFGFGLNKYSTPEKCFDFWINNGFYYRLERRYFRNLNEFSNLIFHQNIQELSNEKIIEIIAYRLVDTYSPINTTRFENLKTDLLIKWKKISM
jgi:hypothetical protein